MRTLLLSAMLALGLVACASAQQATSGQPGARLTEETLSHDGRTRRFLVHDFSGGKRAPVVIVLHGGGGHPENAVDMS